MSWLWWGRRGEEPQCVYRKMVVQDLVANTGNNSKVHSMDVRNEWDQQGSLLSRKGTLECKAPREH